MLLDDLGRMVEAQFMFYKLEGYIVDRNCPSLLGCRVRYLNDLQQPDLIHERPRLGSYYRPVIYSIHFSKNRLAIFILYKETSACRWVFSIPFHLNQKKKKSLPGKPKIIP